MLHKRLHTFIILALFTVTALKAQQTVSGRVISEFDRQPVDFAQVAILELRTKTRTGEDGRFSIEIPEAGEYTVIVTMPGFKPYREKKELQPGSEFQVLLQTTTVQGGSITVRAERDVQKISRNTLSMQDIKDTPATFGDSLGALATLPGVIRTGGIFGPLVIRGAGTTANRYFIDDVPVLNPQHFGALQSVISNDMIDRIDLFSSAFPARYGGATGAVIDIHTVDDVKEFGGNVDVSIISSNFLVKDVWQKRGRPMVPSAPGESVEEQTNSTAQNDDAIPGGAGVTPATGLNDFSSGDPADGYWIAAGRVGYLTLLIPPIYELLTGDDIGRLPEYYDYQLKGKAFLDEKGHHSLTLLLFGSYDTFKFSNDEISQDDQEAIEKGADPLLTKFRFNNDVLSNNQGIYYTYEPSSKLKNTLILFNTLNDSRFYIATIDNPGGDLEIDVNANPNIFGIKDRNLFSYWNDIAQLRTTLEYNLWYFKSSGVSQVLKEPAAFAGNPEDDQVSANPVDFKTENHTLSAAFENKFTFGGFTVIPGVRFDYLELTEETTTAPRALTSYAFETGTTVSAAGGIYYSFPQANQFLFNQPFNQQPEVATDKDLKAEEAVHRVVGVEQQIIELWTAKLEVFQNSYKNLVTPYPAAGTTSGLVSTGRNETRGVEILLRKDRYSDSQGAYGWLSYTYTEAEIQNNVPPTNDAWLTNPNEQRHSLKLVAGYSWDIHNIGARFEFYSGQPYTPIIGSTCDTDYSGPDCSNPTSPTGTPRYIPEYSNNYYSERFPFAHRLDIRYTQTINYSWGSFRWYVEIINIYNYKPINEQDWKYNRPFQPGGSPPNPELVSTEGLNLIPNFGLEWRF